MDKFSTIKRTDDNTIQITDYETQTRQYGFKLKYSTLVVLIVIVIAAICIVLILSNSRNQNKNNADRIESGAASLSPFSEDGFILSNSSTQYITSKDFNVIKNKAEKSDYSYGELLRYSVNEIYARHGYRFISGGKFDSFYSQYQWYLDTKKVDEVSWGKLNEYEQYNLCMLVEEEDAL